MLSATQRLLQRAIVIERNFKLTSKCLYRLVLNSWEVFRNALVISTNLCVSEYSELIKIILTYQKVRQQKEYIKIWNYVLSLYQNTKTKNVEPLIAPTLCCYDDNNKGISFFKKKNTYETSSYYVEFVPIYDAFSFKSYKFLTRRLFDLVHL